MIVNGIFSYQWSCAYMKCRIYFPEHAIFGMELSCNVQHDIYSLNLFVYPCNNSFAAQYRVIHNIWKWGMQQYLHIAYQFANLCKYILQSLQNHVDDYKLNFIQMYRIILKNSLIPIATVLHVSYSTYYILTKSNLYMLEIWDNINSSSLTLVSWARKEDPWSIA